MAGIQRVIKSGIRLYNYNPRAINFAASSINRLSALANPYRSFCSGSCGDGQSNVKRTFNIDTFAMVNALKANGVSTKHAETITCSMAQVFAELEKDPAHSSTLLKSKFESLLENINKSRPETSQCAATIRLDQLISKETEAMRRLITASKKFLGLLIFAELGIFVLIYKNLKKDLQESQAQDMPNTSS